MILRGWLNVGLILATLSFLGVFSLIAIFFPRIAIALYLSVAVLWPDYIVLVFSDGPGLNPQRLLLPIVLAAWCIHVSMLPTYRARFTVFVRQNRKLVILLFLFYLWSIIAGITAPFAQSKAVMGAIYQSAFYAFPLVLVSTYFNEERDILALLGLLVWLVLPIQILGGIEWITNQIPFAEFVDPASEAARKTLSGSLRLGIHRSTSVFNNPLSYSQFLLFMAPFLCYQAIYGRQRFSRSFALLQCFLLPISVATTASRTSAICGILILIALIWIWVSTRIKRAATKRLTATILTIVGLPILAATVWYIISVTVFIGGRMDSSTFARIVQLFRGVPEIMKAPFLGYGTYNGISAIDANMTSIDNYYLTVALEQGLVGLILHIAIQGLIIWRLYSLKEAAETAEMRNLFRLGIIAFLGLYIFELSLSVTEVFSVIYVFAGLLLSLPIPNIKIKGKYSQ